MLEPTGCRLVSARSGDDALRALLKDDFAVILLDVQMPGLDGFETAELIRARERSRAVPIIFVTAISKERHHVFRGYETGAVDYLFKPLDPVVLRSKVEVFVESYERGRALAEREELLRATFEDAPIGMARADDAGRLRHVNRVLCETVGRAPEDLVGRTLDELGPRADAGIDEIQRRDLAAGIIPRYQVERRLTGPGGTSIPVLVSVSQATSREGSPADLILHVEDLRERRRAERDREQLIRAQSARAQAEAASERLRLMQSIAVAALGAEDLDGLLRELLDRLLEALDADRAAVVLTEDGERVVARAAGGVETVVERDNGARGDDVVDRVAAERGVVDDRGRPGRGHRRELARSRGQLAAGGAARRRRADHRLAARRHADAARVRRRDDRPAGPRGGPGEPRDRAHAPVRARAPDRRRAAALAAAEHAAGDPGRGAGARATSRATTASTSAATGTTRSRCRAGASRSRSATSSAAGSRRRRRWARCAARCARSSCRPTTAARWPSA